MKLPLKFIATMLMVVLVGGAVFACGGGTTTPPVETPPVETPPVETPPAETPPVETPPVETPSYSYTATIFGEEVTIPADARGAMLEDFEKTSPDGLVTIKFEKGTKITNADMVPFWQSVSIGQARRVGKHVAGIDIDEGTIGQLPTHRLTYGYGLVGQWHSSLWCVVDVGDGNGKSLIRLLASQVGGRDAHL